MSPPVAVVRGRSPIVLVAPHAGRRDATARPWGGEPLKMNDLHTGALTRELATRLDASAIVNDARDRNDVDLNRIGAAHDAAPEFLAALAECLEDALSRHETACVLAVHGWNVVQPAVDVGLGVKPSVEAVSGGAGAAVSAAFATTALSRLAMRLGARGIAVTPGLRYPARGRENLVQLFTGRYGADPRDPVRRLARLAPRIDAVQLELSLALRMPGPWRDAFVAACTQALREDASGDAGTWPSWDGAAAHAPERLTLELVAPGLSGLASIDERGGRLLLFADDGRLFTFTGERVGAHESHRVAGLRMTTTPERGIELSYDGPMLAFPDTAPFLDLEQGLARATLVRAAVTLHGTPTHAEGEITCPAESIAGAARLGAEQWAVRGHAIREGSFDGRAHVGLRLSDGTVIVAHGGPSGLVCRGGRHVTVHDLALEHRDGDPALRLTAEDADGNRLDVTVEIDHRLPVVRAGSTRQLVFAACRHAGVPAGWVQLPSS